MFSDSEDSENIVNKNMKNHTFKISSPGTWILDSDIHGTIIVKNVKNVLLDLKRYTINACNAKKAIIITNSENIRIVGGNIANSGIGIFISKKCQCIMMENLNFMDVVYHIESETLDKIQIKDVRYLESIKIKIETKNADVSIQMPKF